MQTNRLNQWVKIVGLVLCCFYIVGCQRLEALWCCNFQIASNDPRIRYEKGAEDLATLVEARLPLIINKIKKLQFFEYQNLSGIRVHIFNNRERFSTFCSSSENKLQAIRSSVSVCLSKPGIQQLVAQDNVLTKAAVTEEALIRVISKMHLMQTTGFLNYNINVPSWFIEGLGEYAVRHLRHQSSSVMHVKNSPQSFMEGVTFDPPYKATLLGHRVAEDFGMNSAMYRYQSGMFIEYLRGNSELAFKQVIGMVVERRSVGDVISFSYQRTLKELWKDHIRALDAKIVI